VRIIFARHGRTAGNVSKALDSRPPGMPLDEVGLAQAEDLARRLAGEPVTAVYASRATRAQQTAAPVAAAHDLPVVVVDGVQEADCGDLDGATDLASHERFQQVYEAWLAGDFAVRVPGGESALEVRARFVAAVEAVAGLDTGPDTVVVVSHGAAIRLGVGALLGEGAETRYVANAGIVILTGGPGRWELAHWDGAEPVAGDVTGGAEVAW
jgi:broad specificity phosphatase PhoE